jgi:hypothetical protein
MGFAWGAAHLGTKTHNYMGEGGHQVSLRLVLTVAIAPKILGRT